MYWSYVHRPSLGICRKQDSSDQQDHWRVCHLSRVASRPDDPGKTNIWFGEQVQTFYRFYAAPGITIESTQFNHLNCVWFVYRWLVRGKAPNLMTRWDLYCVKPAEASLQLKDRYWFSNCIRNGNSKCFWEGNKNQFSRPAGGARVSSSSALNVKNSYNWWLMEKYCQGLIWFKLSDCV